MHFNIFRPLLLGGKTSNEVENKNSFSLVARNLGDNLKINFLVGNALFERIWEDAKFSENIARDGLGSFSVLVRAKHVIFLMDEDICL